MNDRQKQWQNADGDGLFRPTLKFSGNVQPFCVDDPIDALPYIAGSFAAAAGELLRARAANCPDPDAWPIMFLYRHACELHLKAIILSGDIILRHKSKPLSGFTDIKDGHLCLKAKTHSFGSLVNGAEYIMTALGLRWPAKGNVVDWDSARQRIGELQAVDPASFTFRYPLDNGGKRVKPAYMTFDIVHFGRTIEAVLGGLEVIALECERLRELP